MPDVTIFEVDENSDNPLDRMIYSIMHRMEITTLKLLSDITDIKRKNITRRDFNKHAFKYFKDKFLDYVGKICSDCVVLQCCFLVKDEDIKDEINDLSSTFTYLKKYLFEYIYNNDFDDIVKHTIYLFTSFVVLHMMVHYDKIEGEELIKADFEHNKTLMDFAFNLHSNNSSISFDFKPEAGKTFYFKLS